jgi:hypothetical protein
MGAEDARPQSDAERALALLRASPHCRSVKPAGSATVMFVSREAAAAVRRRRALPERSDIQLAEWPAAPPGCGARVSDGA